MFKAVFPYNNCKKQKAAHAKLRAVTLHVCNISPLFTCGKQPPSRAHVALESIPLEPDGRGPQQTSIPQRKYFFTQMQYIGNPSLVLRILSTENKMVFKNYNFFYCHLTSHFTTLLNENLIEYNSQMPNSSRKANFRGSFLTCTVVNTIESRTQLLFINRDSDRLAHASRHIKTSCQIKS